jgi:DmsE family decaheme c-type cytochrome
MRCLILLLALFPLAAQSPSPDHAGDQMCQACHPDKWEPFSRNAHFKLTLSSPNPKTTYACEGCHGPGKAHVDGRGDKTKINRIAGRPVGQVLSACLACHSKDFPRSNIRRSAHSTHDVACTSCHSIHASTAPKYLLARAQQRDLCYSCHLDVKAQFEMPYRHRVNEGALQCTDCHNPHGDFNPTWRAAIRPRLVTQSFGDDQSCLKCHTDKRGPFVYEHPPVRIDGCETCHSPHGSPNPRLMKRPATFTLCLECHTGVAGFGKTGFGDPAPVASFHRLDQVQFQNCTTCHARIHGSNVDRRFQR